MFNDFYLFLYIASFDAALIEFMMECLSSPLSDHLLMGKI